MGIMIEGLPREVKYLLLDFDGTIIDIRPKWWTPIEQSFLEVSGEVPEAKLRREVGKIMNKMPQEPSKFFLLKIIWEIGRSGGLSRWQTLRFVLKARTKFSESKHINELIPGVDQFLEMMEQKNIPVAIVTTADEKEIKIAKENLPQIKNYPVVTRNDVEFLKPHPQPVLRGIELLNGSAPQTVFVGDFRTDIQAGKAAGVMTVGLSSFVPEVSIPGLEEADPDLIVPYLPDLMDRIKSD